MRLFEAGDVFRGPFLLGDTVKHRPIIVAVDEDVVDGTLIVCTTSVDSIWSDSTTELLAGCHPLIDKDCRIVYGEAQVFAKAQADRMRGFIAAGKIEFDPT